MGRIQAGIGLISGFPIQETVDQLVALSARPRDQLESRNAALTAQQVAVTELSGLVLGIQAAMERLGNEEAFHEKAATSSNRDLLTVAITGSPTSGRFQYTAVRQAQSHHMMSSGFAQPDEPIGAGSLSLQFGGFVDADIPLDDLNGGGGVERGMIRITDRSGASAVIDLRFALTVEDVLGAINANDQINVTVETEGDAFRLIDNTGQSVANLKVQEFGAGKTAADLGLTMDVAANESTGQDLLYLHDNVRLDRLNDGNGVASISDQADLEISFRDGSANLQIDLGSSTATIGLLMQTLNLADPSRFKAELSVDADRLVLTDLTAGGGTFSVTSPAGGTTAEDLGITTAESGGIITGRRLLGGLKTTLVSTLDGGSGLQLGLIHLQDRTGSVATVDLSSAETLEDVIREINNAGNGLNSRVNDARNGIVVSDNTAGTNNLVIANLGGTTTADALGITIDEAVSLVDGGSLHRQIVSRGTQLDSLNRGRGVATGSFLITDSAGVAGAINLTVLDLENVGDLIDAVNDLSIGVTAGINGTGDGILLTDTADGPDTLRVTDAGSGTTAADLGIAGVAVEVDIDGTPAQVIDGGTTLTVEIDAEDTLEDVIEKINDLDAGVAATLLNVGSGSAPYRLSLFSTVSGRAGQLLVDAKDTGISFQEIVTAQDALLLIGSADSPGAGVLTSSPTDTFGQLIEGVDLTVNSSSTEPVQIQIETTDVKLTESIHSFVEEFNRLQGRLDQLTFFNEADNTTGILFGTNEALRIETGFASLLTRRFVGVGAIGSFEQLGLSLSGNGNLTFDEQEFTDAFADNPDGVTAFFVDKDIGAVDRLTAFIDQLAAEGDSLLSSRADSIRRTIELNAARIQRLNERLDRERDLLLTQFFAMESAIATMQRDLNTIATISALPSLTLRSDR